MDRANDPLHQLLTHLSPEATTQLLEGCLRLLDAQTLDELVHAEHQLALLTPTSSHNLLTFALDRIADYGDRKRCVFQAALAWGHHEDPQARAVEIFPSVWRIRLRIADNDQWVAVRVLHDAYLPYFDYYRPGEDWSTEVTVDD